MDYYVLTDPNHPTAPITTSASVPNIAVRKFGSTVSSWNGTNWIFDWSSVNSDLTYLPSSGKWSLSISGGVNAPAALLTMGDTVYSFTYAGHSFSMCVPWGINYLAWWEAMQSSAASTFGTNTQLHHVVFGINGITQETTMPNPSDTWWTTTGGYSASTVQSLYTILQNYMSGHWPRRLYLCGDFVPGNFPPNSPPPTPPYDEGVILLNALVSDFPARSCVQNNGVQMVGSPPTPFIWSDIAGAGAAIFGFQEYGSLMSDSDSIACAAAAQTAGAAYYEIYPSHLHNF